MSKPVFGKYNRIVFWALIVLTIHFIFAKGYVENGIEIGMRTKQPEIWDSGYSAGTLDAEIRYADYISPEKYLPIEVDNANKADARAIAKVLYGVRGYRLSERAKTAIVEVILSRVECDFGEFGDTVQEVCEKPEQWIGYTGEYLEEDYKLALDILNSTDRGRITPDGCLFLVCDRGEVSVRKEWNSKNCWVVE